MSIKIIFILQVLINLAFSAVIEIPLVPNTYQLNLTQAVGAYRDLSFEQNLDHFNYNDDRTFQQRLLLHDEFFDHNGGVIFFYAGSQENIITSWNNDLFLLENAPRFKALVVFVEHRYYGRSLPFSNSSWTGNNIAFLTVEQALADYTSIIKYLQDTYRQNLNEANYPVVVFGAGYGGVLASQLRFKYPAIVDGALASAAHLNVISGLSPSTLFYREVTKIYNRQAQCVPLIRTAFDLVATWYRTPPAANSTLQQRFRLCRAVANNADYRQLLLFLRNALTKMAIYNYPYSSTASGAPFPANPVKTACDLMLLNSRDPLLALNSVISLYYNATAVSPTCLDIYSDFVECSDTTGCSSSLNSVAFDYQSCAELPILQESNSLTDMFPPLTFSTQNRKDYCKRRWNITIRNSDNRQYWNPKASKAITNLLFVDSTSDPWCSLSAQPTIGDSVSAIKISEGAHRIDLKGSNTNDPISVRAARMESLQHIAKWINEARSIRK